MTCSAFVPVFPTFSSEKREKSGMSPGHALDEARTTAGEIVVYQLVRQCAK